MAVPYAPGVPPLRAGQQATLLAEILLADALSYVSSAGSQWGIYTNDGAPVILTGHNTTDPYLADTITAFDYKEEWIVADYPLEKGKFESYDKVYTPFQIRVQLATSGSKAALLLAKIASLAPLTGDQSTSGGSQNLFWVVTPQVSYKNCTFQRYDYRRTTTNGVTLIAVNIMFLEIRVEGYNNSNVLSPSAAPTFNRSTLPAIPTPQLLQQIIQRIA